MAIKYTSYLHKVLPEVSGCPTPIALDAIKDAVIDFCLRSTVWRVDHADIDFVEGVAAYTLTNPSNANIVGIAGNPRYKSNGDKILQETVESLELLDPRWRTRTGVQPNYVYATLVESEPEDGPLTEWALTFSPTPSEDKSEAVSSVVLVLIPKQDATEGPQHIYDRWLAEIAAGAKWRLMLMPNVEWSNPQLADYYRVAFYRGIGEAEAFIKTGGKMPQTNRYRRVQGYY